jgi:hypothetical protein
VRCLPPIPRPRCLVLLALAVVGVDAGSARAQNGWLPASWFSATDADDKAMYPLAEKDGPWLVLAATFRGDAARDDARRLVQELRRRQKLPAYTHEKAFDYSGEQQGVGFNRDGTPKKMRHLNAEQVVEVAVLVGDFASPEEDRAQKMLQRVKALQPEALGGKGGKSGMVSEFLGANAHLAKNASGTPNASGNKNAAATRAPLRAAMMIRNPLLKEEYFRRQEVDDFVLRMNADVPHSLLDCPARYSVRVATFTGSGVLGRAVADDKALESAGLVNVAQLSEAMRSLGWTSPSLRAKTDGDHRLVEAFDKAHRLTAALRRQGWQAWQFHDRDSSVVCVGCIGQLAVEQADGVTAVNPEIARIVAALGPDQAKLAQGVIEPRIIDGILLDVDPKPIDVPRVPTRRRK